MVGKITDEIKEKILAEYSDYDLILFGFIEKISKQAEELDEIIGDFTKSLLVSLKLNHNDLAYKSLNNYFKFGSDYYIVAIINAVREGVKKGNNQKGSSGKRKIEQFLLKHKIDFRREFVFKKLAKRRFDFFLPKKNIAIEYDGPQHFKSIKYFGGDEKFEKQRLRDMEKNIFCQKNKIKLLRIPFRNLKNIEEILSDFLGVKNGI
nr:MAG TPA: restriction enzyme [Caudoviricetes sp.]